MTRRSYPAFRHAVLRQNSSAMLNLAKRVLSEILESKASILKPPAESTV